ncbi:MAG: aspartyl protease family protein [Planctomycetaceae bacterium]
MSNSSLTEPECSMGRVVVSARIDNLGDLYSVRRRLMDAADVRWVEVDKALIDTGATCLGLPPSLIEQLGLLVTAQRSVNTPTGVRQANVYEAVRLRVQDRDCVVDVTEVAESCPVLIGQVPLELMDFVVCPRSQQITGNPEHGGEQMYDLF